MKIYNKDIKQLLQEIINISCSNCDKEDDYFLITPTNNLKYCINGVILYINIYELIYLCKEWAFEQGYILTSWKKDNNWYVCEVYDLKNNEEVVVINNKTYQREKSYLEVIIKVCNWILNEK